MSASIDEKYKYVSIEQSIAEKDWAAGSSKLTAVKEWRINSKGVATYSDVEYPPSLLKAIDEVVVNALDHAVKRNHIGTLKVTRIDIDLRKDGTIVVYNNGAGIEVAVHPTASAKEGCSVYVPTLVFGYVFQGSNLKREGIGRIVGGTNGIGAKIANIYSTMFCVETCDGQHMFSQVWNGFERRGVPTIVPTKAGAEQYTRISFTPNYVGQYGYVGGFTPALYDTLYGLINMRVHMAAAYLGHINGPNSVQLRYNGALVRVQGMADVAAVLFPGATCYTAKTTNPTDRYTWEVAIVPTPTKIGKQRMEHPYISNVNGIVVSGGKHIERISKLLHKTVKAQIIKACKDSKPTVPTNIIGDNAFILLNSIIPDPLWGGQCKDALKNDGRAFVPYGLEEAYITRVSTAIYNLAKDGLKTKAPEVQRRTADLSLSEYIEARKAGKKQAQKCSLLLAEGLSAMQRLATGISETIGWDYWGIMSIGGVIINAQRASTSSGDTIQLSDKFVKNKFITNLLHVTGLNTKYKYDPTSPTYSAERRALAYGCIVICVDQDLDGKGLIAGLILALFSRMFPRLLDAGYLKWFSTPVIRAYPNRGGKVLDFYSLQDHERWAGTHGEEGYDIRYYKGLGTHSREEVVHMFKHFTEHLVTYTADSETERYIDIYFGSNPATRKEVLSVPQLPAPRDLVEEQLRTLCIKCSDHLKYETHFYQIDNIGRKLYSYVDGQNEAGRKVLTTLLAISGSTWHRVDSLTGEVLQRTKYHHGGDCLASVITYRGLVTCGGRQLPPIVPRSNFGSRREGGADASAPRYIYGRSNRTLIDIIYPPEDYYLLEFERDEGVRTNPKYFVPIVPVAILESECVPGHGWKMELWARDIYHVIATVRDMINYSLTKVAALRPYLYADVEHKWTGDLRVVRGVMYSYGRYYYNESTNTIHISELPLRMWTLRYIKMIEKKAKLDDRIIAKIRESGSDTIVDIEIELKAGAIDIIQADYGDYYSCGIEDYFRLRAPMISHINLCGTAGEVITFRSYEDVLLRWYPLRLDYYVRRIERKIAVLRLRCVYYENIIRYINEHRAMELAKRPIAEMRRILHDRGYTKIDSKRLNAPKYVPTSELERAVLGGKRADYGYLLSLTDTKKSTESLAEYEADLVKTRAEIEDLLRTKPGDLWLQELDELEETVRYGHKTKWMYGDLGKFKYD